MSEEIKQLIDYLQEFVNDDRKQITKYGVEISQDNTKLLLKYIEQLQQENQRLKQWDKSKDTRNSRQRVANAKLMKENKSLKEKIDIAETNYDIIYGYFTQVNELLGTELCEEVIDEILKLKRNNNILTEFEKWLEEELKEKTFNAFPTYDLEKQDFTNNEIHFAPVEKTYGEVLDKLQELKGDKDATTN